MPEPLKLSEAIRLGGAIRPQIFGPLFEALPDGTIGSCAWGGALEAAGLVTVEGAGAFVILRPAPEHWVFAGEGECPQCKKSVRWPVMVSHLNDTHKWSREAIADFVEKREHELERQPTPEQLISA